MFWVDILGHTVNRLSLADDLVTSWTMPEPVGWVIERERGGFVAGMASGFYELTLDPVALRLIVDPEPDRPLNRMNDAKADADGRIWAGTMPFDCREASGALYRLDPDHRVTLVDAPYTIPNGPAITPDARVLFHTDTSLRTIFRFDVQDDGTLGNRVPHIIFDPDWGYPDGMTLDADGCLWVAHWGAARVSRFDPTGARMRSVVLPTAQITNMTFAGDKLDRLFVTSAADGLDEEHAGALFEVDPGCSGLPTQLFAG